MEERVAHGSEPAVMPSQAEFEEQKESRRVDADVLDEGEMGE